MIMTRDMERNRIEEALSALGALLHAAGERHAVVVVGGATLSLLGLVQRTTSDVDVIARARRSPPDQLELIQAEPFPSSLQNAVRVVARDLRLDEHWMNGEVGLQWSQGLPPWILEDITWMNYGGGLDVGLVGRRTLIALKLFAAVDGNSGERHIQDLTTLLPTDAELDEAMSWVRGQDAALEWVSLVGRTIEHVRKQR
jgi:hypothetical protein